MSALRKIQEDFRDTVLGHDDVVAPHLTAARGPVARRIAVYRNTVQTSLTDALVAAYPVVRRIVGGTFFAGLAWRYIAAHPPAAPQLSDYGAAMADFIAAVEPLRPLAYLPDVARLEWARGEAYFAADAETLAPQTLAAVLPVDLPDVRWTLHPATRLVTSDFPIHRIWQMNQPDVADVPEVDMTVAEAVLVGRAHNQLTTRKLSASDAAMLAAMAAGATLAEAVGDAEPAFNLQEALQLHLQGGTFSGIVLQTPD